MDSMCLFHDNDYFPGHRGFGTDHLLAFWKVHGGRVYLFGFDKLELHPAAGPGDEVRIPGVVQQGHQELPQLQRASPLVRRSLAEYAAAAATAAARFLLHLACGEDNSRENDDEAATR